jgi:hypothetical protein
MLKVRNILLWIIPILFLLSCSENNSTEPEDQLLKVQVDLQNGFAGHLVILEFNGEEFYRADLSESAPFSGPLASFSTFLPRGQNKLYVFWQLDGYQVGPFKEDSLTFKLGEENQYFIGLSTNDDFIEYVLQDDAFLYL